MIRVRMLQLGFVCVLIVALELLCRSGIIDRFTMIPPSEMVQALAQVVATAPWFWPDVSYTLGNLAAAIAATHATAVDVSSGVEESPGRKSPEKIAAFLRLAASL